MNCKKYTLTNTGSTFFYFNYRKCGEAEFQYQIKLKPGQRRNIWLIDGTFSSPLGVNIEIKNQGVFPITPSNSQPAPSSTPTPTPSSTPVVTLTPTPSITPSNTASSNVTPSVTPTNTVTPSITPTNTTTPSLTPTNTSTPTPTKTPCIQTGTTYQGGIVGYVNNNCNGIIFSTQTVTGGTWNQTGYSVTTYSALFSGTTNTNNINAFGYLDPNNIANQTLNLNISGYTDWVIPSHLDLIEVMKTITSGSFGIPDGQYWSSTQWDVNNALYVQLSGATYSTTYGLKTGTKAVIPIRYF